MSRLIYPVTSSLVPDTTASSLAPSSIGSWTLQGSTVTKDSITAPSSGLVAEGLVADTGATAHWVQSAAGSLTASDLYGFEVFVKSADKTWAALRMLDNSVNYFTYVNLADGTIGTDDNGMHVRVEDFGGGWYRIKAVRIIVATTVTFYIYAAEGDNDLVYTGDGGTVDIHVWFPIITQWA